MSIKNWPEQERPREKLLERGATALSDAELLAIFLRVGMPGKTVMELARELLNHFQGLRALFNAPLRDFSSIGGVGPSKYTQLQAALELGRRYLKESLSKRGYLSNPTETRAFLVAKLRDQKQEIFSVLFLDTQHRMISYEPLFHGTINRASVYPREVVKRTLHHNAAAVIFAHNHPSGIAEPSETDMQITKQLTQALALIDVCVLDHFVIGEGEVISFVEKGFMT